MVEKFESGLVDSFCHCYFTYFVLPEGQKQKSLWLMIARQIKGLIIILIPIHGCSAVEDLSALP